MNLSKEEGSVYCPDSFGSQPVHAREVLYNVFEKLEKERGAYFSLLKEYTFDFDRNDKKTNTKLKEVIAFLQNYSGIVGPNKALKDLRQGLIRSNKNLSSSNEIYSDLKKACEHNTALVIKKRITNFYKMI